MKKYITITNDGFARRGVAQRSVAKKIKPGPVTATYVIIALIFVVAIFYLFQVTSIATTGYTQRELNNKIDDLKKQQEGLEMQMTDMESLNEVQGRVKRLNLVPVSEVKYVRAPAAEVASR